MSKDTNLFGSISCTFHVISCANAHFTLVLCLIMFHGISKTFEVRGSNLRRFGSHSDHFQSSFSLKWDPMHLCTEEKTFTSKEKRRGVPALLMRAPCARIRAACHCQKAMRSPWACMESTWPSRFYRDGFLHESCGLHAPAQVPACLETIKGQS